MNYRFRGDLREQAQIFAADVGHRPFRRPDGHPFRHRHRGKTPFQAAVPGPVASRGKTGQGPAEAHDPGGKSGPDDADQRDAVDGRGRMGPGPAE